MPSLLHGFSPPRPLLSLQRGAGTGGRRLAAAVALALFAAVGASLLSTLATAFAGRSPQGPAFQGFLAGPRRRAVFRQRAPGCELSPVRAAGRIGRSALFFLDDTETEGAVADVAEEEGSDQLSLEPAAPAAVVATQIGDELESLVQAGAVDDSPRLLDLVLRADAALEAAGARTTSQMMWSAASVHAAGAEGAVLLQDLHPQLFDAVVRNMRAMDLHEVYRTLWSVAVMQEEELFLRLLPLLADATLLTPIEGYNVTDAVGAAWAIARLREAVPSLELLLPGVLFALTSKADELTPDECATVLWVIAKCRDLPHDETPGGIKAIALEKFIEGEGGNVRGVQLADTFWAAEQLRVSEEDLEALMSTLLGRLEKERENLEPEELKRILVSAAELAPEAPEAEAALVMLAEPLENSATALSVEALCNTIEALFDLEPDEESEDYESLFGTVMDELRHRAPMFEIPDLLHFARLFKPLDDLGLLDEEMVEVTVERVMQLKKKMRPKTWAELVPMVVWSCAQVGVHPAPFFNEVATELVKKTSGEQSPWRHIMQNPEDGQDLNWAFNEALPATSMREHSGAFGLFRKLRASLEDRFDEERDDTYKHSYGWEGDDQPLPDPGEVADQKWYAEKRAKHRKGPAFRDWVLEG